MRKKEPIPFFSKKDGMGWTGMGCHPKKGCILIWIHSLTRHEALDLHGDLQEVFVIGFDWVNCLCQFQLLFVVN